MAEQSFPFENIDTTESQFSQWATNFQDTGVQGNPSDSNLKVTAEGSTLTVSVAAGQAFIRGHYYINTDAIELTIPSAGLDTRIDYVVIELDPALNTITAKTIQGTAVASNPVAPTLTQTATGIYQLPVAMITIPTSTLAITNAMISDVRTFMSNRVGIWTTATRPENPVQFSTIGYNTTINAHEFWNGTSWVGFADPITTEGDLIVGGEFGPERLPIGADGEVLTVVSGEVAWADAAGGGGMTLISTTTLSGAGVDFTSIPQSYIHLQLIFRDWVINSDSSGINIQFNGESGTVYDRDPATGSVNAPSHTQLRVSRLSDDTVTENSSIVTVYDYANSSTWKMTEMKSVSVDATTTTSAQFTNDVQLFFDTTAISTINIFPSAGEFSGGTVLLYGVK